MKHQTINEIDVYPVGLLSDLRMLAGRLKHRKESRGIYPGPWRSFGYRLRVGIWVPARRGEWRSLRNHFNGYLAEHADGETNAGRGWTRRAAVRRLHKIRAVAATLAEPEGS